MHRANNKTRLVLTLLGAIAFATGAKADDTSVTASSELAHALAWQEAADALMREGNYQQAATLYALAIPIFEAQGLDRELAVLRHQLGFSLVGAGDNIGAVPHFEANRAYHQAQGRIQDAGNYAFYIAQAYTREKDFKRALKLLEEVRVQFANQPEQLAEIDHWRVTSLEQLDMIEEANDVLDEAARALPKAVWQRQLAADRSHINPAPSDPARPALFRPTLLCISTALVLIFLFWLAARNRRLRGALISGALFVGSIGVMLGLVEMILWAIEPEKPTIRHLLHPSNQQVRFVPRRGVMPGVDYDKTSFTTNAAGLRADPLLEPQAMRILAIGGSSTEALFLDDRDAWPHVLQEELRLATERDIWVGNAGKSGLSSVSHVVQLHFYLPELNPDVVLLTAGINDLNQCVSGGLQNILDNARFIQEPDFALNYRRYVFAQILPEAVTNQWRLADLWERAKGRTAAQHQAVTGRFHYVIQDKAGEFYIEQRRRRQVAEKRETTPNIQACLIAFEDNLRRAAAMAKQHGTRLVLATQGSLYRPDLSADEEALLWFGAVDKNPFAPEPPQLYYTAAAMAKMLDEYNTATLRVCASEQLVCLDTDAVLPKTSASYYDDVHLNIQGSHMLAKAFAALLLEQGIVTRGN